MLLTLLRRAVHAAAFLLALACAAAALAAQGGRFSDRLDVLTHFAPFFLAGGVAAGALWAAFVRREGGFFTMVLSATAILASGVLVAPELAAADRTPAAPADGETIKVLQLNVWGRNAEPERTTAWVLAQDADVVVVQEAYGGLRSVGRMLNGHFTGRTSCAEPNPHCSTVILYNRPALAEGGLAAGGEPFVAAGWVTLAGPGGPFTVVGAHLTWPYPAGPQQAQSRRLAETLDRFDRRTAIVAGDFNSTPWSFSLRRQDRAFGLERRTRALPSWPVTVWDRKIEAPFPVLPIDHVYAGSGWRTVKVERGPRLGSDHYPVVVTLSRVSAAPSKAAR